MQHEPSPDQNGDHSNIIGTKIPDAVKGQEAGQIVPVDDDFGKGDPAEEKGQERREFYEERQLGKADRDHGSDSVDETEDLLPLQARLKSSGLRIGELAALAGVRASAIRYYEALGLMPPPGRRSGWRIYGASEVKRLKLIAMARTLGFSINDLKALAGSNTEVRRATAAERAALIREKIAALAGSAAILESLAACACTSEADCLLGGAA